MVEFNILSESDKKLIHSEALRILSEAGVHLPSPPILAMLKEKGCEVDESAGLVKFPAALVEEALKTAPKQFILGGLDSKNDMRLGEGNTYVATDGQSCFVYDSEKGERRETVMQDLVDAARLVDQLDYIRCFWPIVSASDAPVGARTLFEAAQTYRVLGKHFQTDCFSAPQAKYYIRMLEAILGSREKVIERKILSFVCCPMSPLSYEAEMMEGCLAMGEVEAPIVILPMPISGTTAPMSLLATVIQNNAEVLAGLTVFQLGRPGMPIIYGAAPGILDMVSTLFCTGSAEGALQNAACCEMAKHYKLPCLISSNCSEAKEPDIQAGREKAASATTAYLSRPDILCGAGLVDTANLFYPELLILDADSIGYAKRIATGINGGAEHALTDVAVKIGPGGTFLSEKSTRQYLRSGEHYHPLCTQRQSYETWLEMPNRSIRDIAKAKAADMLTVPEKTYLSEAVMGKLQEILAEAEKEFCVE